MIDSVENLVNPLDLIRMFHRNLWNSSQDRSVLLVLKRDRHRVRRDLDLAAIPFGEIAEVAQRRLRDVLAVGRRNHVTGENRTVGCGMRPRYGLVVADHHVEVVMEVHVDTGAVPRGIGLVENRDSAAGIRSEPCRPSRFQSTRAAARTGYIRKAR